MSCHQVNGVWFVRSHGGHSDSIHSAPPSYQVNKKRSTRPLESRSMYEFGAGDFRRRVSSGTFKDDSSKSSSSRPKILKTRSSRDRSYNSRMNACQCSSESEKNYDFMDSTYEEEEKRSIWRKLFCC